MRKFKITIFSILTLLLVNVSGFAQEHDISKLDTPISTDTFKAEKNKKGDALPKLNLLTWEDQPMNNDQFAKGEPVLLVMFNPGCGHCKEILTKVKGNLGMFKNTTIVFVAGQPLHGELPRFVGEMRADKIPNLFIASDHGDFIGKHFEYNGIPQIMLYNAEHQLQHIYYSEASLLDLQRHLFVK